MKWLLFCAAACYLFGGVRRPAFLAGLLLQFTYLALRGFRLGRLPLIGPHDTLVFFATAVAVMTAPFLFARHLKADARFAWGSAFLAALLTLVASLFPILDFPLPPVLRTYWFELHVALAFFAYALFGVGAIIGALFLSGGVRGLLDLQYRAALVGYSFFSASMVAGGIWGYYAWGTYWLWTPKELWTSVLWLFYSLYLHLRLKGRGWDRLVAWGGIVGFAVALFTYLGVSLLMKSSHSF